MGQMSPLSRRCGPSVRTRGIFSAFADSLVLPLDKEVQGYYEDGMRVPDDIVLMWTDDK